MSTVPEAISPEAVDCHCQHLLQNPPKKLGPSFQQNQKWLGVKSAFRWSICRGTPHLFRTFHEILYFHPTFMVNQLTILQGHFPSFTSSIHGGYVPSKPQTPAKCRAGAVGCCAPAVVELCTMPSQNGPAPHLLLRLPFMKCPAASATTYPLRNPPAASLAISSSHRQTCFALYVFSWFCTYLMELDVSEHTKQQISCHDTDPRSAFATLRISRNLDCLLDDNGVDISEEI